jgi:hypothetical protein
MARIYYFGSTTSDLSGGADFSRYFYPNPENSGNTGSISIAPNATEVSYGFTPALHPGTAGTVTGDYVVDVDITTANTNIFLAIQLHRINSAGTIQTSSAISAEQQLTTTGINTFTFTGLSLGTFTSTDRVRIDFRCRNNAAHTNQSFAIGYPNTDIVTPWTARFSIVS